MQQLHHWPGCGFAPLTAQALKVRVLQLLEPPLDALPHHFSIRKHGHSLRKLRLPQAGPDGFVPPPAHLGAGQQVFGAVQLPEHRVQSICFHHIAVANRFTIWHVVLRPEHLPVPPCIAVLPLLREDWLVVKGCQGAAASNDCPAVVWQQGRLFVVRVGGIGDWIGEEGESLQMWDLHQHIQSTDVKDLVVAEIELHKARTFGEMLHGGGVSQVVFGQKQGVQLWKARQALHR
mmetsp:Transcript_8947/g.25755  ORF Transcript_8947/g.25755 Transcript_8947/m.25755 type:complete len:233 (-) Transcript_8947:568-1266(-)